MNLITQAYTADFDEINRLLQANDLTDADAGFSDSYYFKATNDNGNIIGVVGLEVYGCCGLLRSLAVNSAHRNKGIADQLINRVIDKAKQINIETLYMLTTTAEVYFEKKGFERIAREKVSPEIRLSKEFSSVCPYSAIVLKKKI